MGVVDAETRGPELLLLGPVELRSAGRPAATGGLKARAVLALLGLAGRRVVSVNQLVDGIWGEDPPAGVGNALQYHVSILRKVLAGVGAGHLLQTQPPGYRLDIGTDAAAFADAAAAARSAAQRGRADEAVAGYESALALWRGPALADLTEVPFAAAKGHALEASRLAVIEEVVDLELAAGHAGPWVPRLEDLVTQHATRERFWAQLMTALYRSGQPAAALAAYARARRLLDEELGVDPSPALRRLQAQVLAHDPVLELAPVRPAGRAPARGVSLLATRLHPGSSPGEARLVLPDGGTTALGTRPVVVGRHPDCDLVLDDLDVSRQHLRIDPVPATSGHQAVDLGSTNGSLLNGRRLTAPTPLTPGDRLEVGAVVLAYEVTPTA